MSFSQTKKVGDEGPKQTPWVVSPSWHQIGGLGHQGDYWPLCKLYIGAMELRVEASCWVQLLLVTVPSGQSDSIARTPSVLGEYP